MTAAAPSEPHDTSDKRSLWAGVIGAPLAWLVHLQAIYALCPWACHHEKTWVLHVISFAFLVLVAALALICWLDWKRVGTRASSDLDDPPAGRKRLVALLGLLLCGLLFTALIAQIIAGFLVNPCPT
jgi:hypothetical protein